MEGSRAGRFGLIRRGCAVVFQDRREAGQQLAAALVAYRDRRPFVLAIPRGGVVVGFEVATALGASLDIVVPRKLRAPYNPELAIGAVAHDGSVYLDSALVSHLDVSEQYLREETARQLEEIQRRMQIYRGDRPPPSLEGTAAIVVDDGIATGSTMIAALRATRAARPAHLVAAIPVAPAEGVAMLRREADDVVCLHIPPMFYAVGQFYVDFGQTDDAEVIELLRRREQEMHYGIRDQGTGTG